MSRQFIEPLERRQLLSAAAGGHEGVQPPSAKTNLTAAEVTTILGQAASQAMPGQVIVVMDDEGITLGIYAMKGSDDNVAPNGTPFKYLINGTTPVDRLSEQSQL